MPERPMASVKSRAHELLALPDGTHDNLLLAARLDSASAADWRRFKPEMYAISAILIDDAVSCALNGYLASSQERIESWCAKKSKGRSAFRMFEDYTRNGLTASLRFERGKALCGKTDRKGLWKRYMMLDDFLVQSVRGMERSRDSITLNRGINTAASVMVNVLELIPQVYEREQTVEADIDKLVDIARRSFPLVADIAKLHVKRFRKLDDLLTLHIEDNDYHIFDPDKFKLKEDRNGYSLALAEDAEDLLMESCNSLDEDEIGCPSMINVNGREGSAMKRLWDWNVSVAPAVYRAHFTSPRSLELAGRTS